MDPQRWREVRARFDELVDLPPDERQRRLAELFDVAPALHDDVSRLLSADAHADGRLAAVDDALPSAGPGGAEARREAVRSRDPVGLSGRTLAHFRVFEMLGAGGMGVVYRAEDTRLRRIVALKIPLPVQLLDASGKARFLREARAVAALDHPNICHVHEVGESEDGQPFLAMPHYSGETLRDRIARAGPLGEDEAADIARQIARGLAAAHQAGIIHRDLKPGNVMILPDGSVKLLDFGLAKTHDVSVTATGDRLGTAAYMAPEQIRGGHLDGRVDLWALGVILYEMLTGRRPFAGESDVAVAHAIVHEAPVPASRWRRIAPALSDILFRLLQRDPSRRISSAEALVAELAPATLAQGSGPRRVVVRRLTGLARLLRGPRGALAIVAIAAAIGLALTRPDHAASGSVGGTSDATAMDLYLRGRAYEARGLSSEDFRSAVALYRRSLARDTSYPLARARLAISEMRLIGSTSPPDALELAAAHARAALAREPGLGDGHLAMGLYWAARNDSARALAAYRAARRALPESGEVPLAMAGLHLRAGRWEAAIAELETVRELSPGDLAAVRMLAYTYARLRRYEEAAEAWEQVTTLVPDDYLSLLIKGYVYIRWRGTADTLSAVLERIPREWDMGGMKTYAAVMAARVARRPTDALPVLDSSRSLVSADVYTYRPLPLLRAQIFDDLKDSAAARAWYERTRRLVRDTLAVRPDDPRLHIAMGWALAGLDRRTEAVAAARRAMALAPGARNAFDALPFVGAAAEVFARAGDTGGAVALLDSLLQLPAGREASVTLLRVDPTWDPIRSDPRFQALLTRRD